MTYDELRPGDVLIDTTGGMFVVSVVHGQAACHVTFMNLWDTEDYMAPPGTWTGEGRNASMEACGTWEDVRPGDLIVDGAAGEFVISVELIPGESTVVLTCLDLWPCHLMCRLMFWTKSKVPDDVLIHRSGRT